MHSSKPLTTILFTYSYNSVTDLQHYDVTLTLLISWHELKD